MRYVGRAMVPAPRRPHHYAGRHLEDVEEPASARSGWSMPLWQELPLLVILALSLALVIRTFFLQAFFIPSGSMEQTLRVQDRVLVNKLIYHLRAPRRGEVVVFRGTDSWASESVALPSESVVAKVAAALGSLVGLAEPNEKDFVKRVIGLPGDAVACCDARGRVTINGHALDEPYVYQNNPIDERSFGRITVPPGRMFVMGDHRGVSQDSRAHIHDPWLGTVPISHVIGKAFATIWPLSDWRTVSVPRTFSEIPSRASPDSVVRSSVSSAGNITQSGFLFAGLVAVPFPRRRGRKLPG